MPDAFFGKDITRARIKYMEEFKDKVTLEVQEFSTDQYEEYNKKITTELLSGEGPDIILVDYSTFPNIRKVMSTNVFCDLNELIKDDKEFKLTDYNEKVLETGVYDGKRFLFPASYDIPSVFTTNEILKKNNIKIDENSWTWDALAKVARDFKNRKNNSSKYLFAGFSFTDIIYSTGNYYFDFKNKKSRFESKEFIKLLNDYKDIMSVSTKDYILKDTYIDDSIVFSEPILSPFMLRVANSITQYNHKNSDIKIIPMPSMDGKSGSFAYPLYSYAINSNCKNKKEAFSFLKVLVSPYVQASSDEEGSNYIYGDLPINTKALDEDIKLYERDQTFSPYNYTDISGTLVTVPFLPLPSSLSINLKELINGIDDCGVIDYEIFNIINAEVNKNFLEGKSTAEQTAKIINDKVNLYLNE